MVPLGLPVTMLSNAFVPTDGMPGWLRLLADWNPVSALTAASRELRYCGWRAGEARTLYVNKF
ncbi:ABC transporter permease [Nonomuraea candida]|uniref:ABC transporter permease n=1 Tax=Nonomuraea candida TaxID=359159 RepID=UPI001FE1497A|nr:ABC transporter permease [Nonomuraea candida]